MLLNTCIEYLHRMTGYTDVLAANGWKCGLSKWHLGDSRRMQKGFEFEYTQS